MVSPRYPTLDGLDVSERPMTSAESRAFAQQPGPGNPNVGPNGSDEARAFRAAPPKPAAVPGAARAAAVESPSLLARGSERVGGLAGKSLRVLGPAGTGAEVVSHFNDYKIDDPSVDSSARGTWNALRQGDFSGAGRSLSKGALETGMDLGSAAANLADLVVPGKATVSTAYHDMLRRTFGDQLKPHDSAPAQSTVAPKFSPSDQSAAETARLLRQNSALANNQPVLGGTEAPAKSPFGTYQKATLRDYSTVDQNEEARRVAQGREVFARDKALGDEMEARRLAQKPTFAVVGDGGGYGLLSKEYQDKRNAKMEMDSGISNLMRQGLSANQAASLLSNQLIQDKANNASLRNAQIGANAQMYGHDVSRQGHELNADVSLRNNALTNATAMAGHNMSMAANRAKLMYDMGVDQRNFAASRFDKGLEQAAKADEQARNALKFFGKDKDGKPFEDTAKGNAAYELLMRQNPNWSQLPLQDRAKLLSDARVHTDLINNLRDHQSNSWWQAMGIMPKDVQADHLPDLRGAKVTEVNPLEGAATYNAERGGYKINVGGKDFYLGRDQVGEDHLSYLKKNGANIGSLGAK